MDVQAIRQGRERRDRHGGDGGHLHQTLHSNPAFYIFLVNVKTLLRILPTNLILCVQSVVTHF